MSRILHDSNPDDSNYTQYAAGRLAEVHYTGHTCSPEGCSDAIQEMYSYNQGGAVVAKRIRLIRGGQQADLNGAWSYDTEGRVTNVTYPTWGTGDGNGSSYNYAYDTMGRLNTMTDVRASSTLISGVTYGVANEVQAITGSFFNETRSYNSLFQLAQITVPGVLNIQYSYSSTMNNGKIASQTDVISGEQVVYTYDALNRLATAQMVTNPNVTQWGQSYNYDGFGNLTDQNVIKGSAKTMHVVYNASTNRQTGDVADANGNLGSGYVYDVANRLLQPSGGSIQYAYDSGNKRVWRGVVSGDGLDEIAFWSPGGPKLGAYHVVVNNISHAVSFSLTGTDVYFGARLIGKGTYNVSCPHLDCVTLASVATDRLGSIGKFYPYGQERPSATQNDTEKFTGYYRDAATGLDYADQRYHQPGVGRFMSPDPYQASAGPSDPRSWNRYSYTRGDPVNRVDPDGLHDRWGWGDDELDDLGLGGGVVSPLVWVAEGISNDRQDCRSEGMVFSFAGGVESCVPPVPVVPVASVPCAATISPADLQYTNAALYVLNENSFNDRTNNPSIMQNLYSEDSLLASILNNRTSDPRFRAGGTTINSQAANAAGIGAGVGSGALPNGNIAFTNGMMSAVGSPDCTNLQDAFAAINSVVANGSSNSQVLYNWGLDAGPNGPGAGYLRNKVFVTQVNNTLFYGLQ